MLLRNEGALLPLDADRLASIAVIGPLADSKRDTLGPWVFDFDLDETVTVLDGIRRRVGTRSSVQYAPGIRPAQRRIFPSMFDMFGGNAPEDPEDFDDDAELRRAVELARESDVAVVVVGEWQNMIGESASRSSLELPGRQHELLQAVVATGHPGGAAGHERPAARPALGSRARAGDPGHLVSRHAGRRGGGEPAVRRRRRRAASCRSPGRGRSVRSR